MRYRIFLFFVLCGFFYSCSSAPEQRETQEIVNDHGVEYIQINNTTHVVKQDSPNTLNTQRGSDFRFEQPEERYDYAILVSDEEIFAFEQIAEYEEPDETESEEYSDDFFAFEQINEAQEHLPQLIAAKEPLEEAAQETPPEARESLEQARTPSQTPPAAGLQPARTPVNTRNTNVIGQGSISVNGVMDYLNVRNKNPVKGQAFARRIVSLYMEEAAAQDVNPDLAIAQMLYWTAFFSNRERVESNNFGGLSRTRDWNGRFPYRMDNGETEGVRAHIQHLRGYARQELKNPAALNVNPRWELISGIRGSAATFEDVFQRWSANQSRYRLNINMILARLYEYSDRRR